MSIEATRLLDAAKQALEALERCGSESYSLERDAITSLRQAIREEALRNVQRLGQEIEAEAEAESFQQEPVAWMHKQGNHEEPSFRQLDDWEIGNGWTQYPLYTHPDPDDLTIAYMSGFHDGKKKREWVGLTDEEVEEDSVFFTESEGFKHGAYWAEVKLKEKNT